MRARFIGAAVLVALLANPVLARKGDIVPQAGNGVAVLERGGKKHSRTKLGPLEIEFEATSGGGFLYVDTKVTNSGDADYEIKQGQVSVTSKGDPADPLDPDGYIELAHQVKPLETNEKGEITEKKGKLPVKVFTPGAQVPGTTSGASLAEQMASDQWEEGSWDQRVHITKELWELKRDVVRYGGTIAPGKSVKGRLIFQRNQVELPVDVSMIVGTKKLTVRFVREK